MTQMLSTVWMEDGAVVGLILLELRLLGFSSHHIFPKNHYLIKHDPA
jgi:hypothetical protein